MVRLKVVFGFAFAVPGVPALAVIVYALWTDGESIAFLSPGGLLILSFFCVGILLLTWAWRERRRAQRRRVRGRRPV